MSVSGNKGKEVVGDLLIRSTQPLLDFEVENLAQKNLDVNSTTRDGRTSLHLASSSGNSRAVEELIASPHIDARATDESDWSALHFAANSWKDNGVLLPLIRRQIGALL